MCSKKKFLQNKNNVILLCNCCDLLYNSDSDDEEEFAVLFSLSLRNKKRKRTRFRIADYEHVIMQYDSMGKYLDNYI